MVLGKIDESHFQLASALEDPKAGSKPTRIINVIIRKLTYDWTREKNAGSGFFGREKKKKSPIVNRELCDWQTDGSFPPRYQ